MLIRSVCQAVVFATLLPASPALAEWGSLKGRIVVDGEPPKPVELTVEKDAFCVKAKPVDQRVLVGEGGGLQNAVVYLRPRRGVEVAVHPSYEDVLAQPVEMSNRGCCFTPRVTLVRAGQSLVVKNEDETAHNTKFDMVKNEAINSVIAGEEQITADFDVEESLPMPVSCNIHPFMRGYVLVRASPYMVVTNAKGEFELKHLPVGEHRFQFWHETGYLKDSAFAGGATDRRGQATLTIEPGEELDLGEIRVSAELLSR